MLPFALGGLPLVFVGGDDWYAAVAVSGSAARLLTAVLAGEAPRHPHLGDQLLAQTLPTVVDAVGGEVPADDLDQTSPVTRHRA